MLIEDDTSLATNLRDVLHEYGFKVIMSKEIGRVAAKPVTVLIRDEQKTPPSLASLSTGAGQIKTGSLCRSKRIAR